MCLCSVSWVKELKPSISLGKSPSMPVFYQLQATFQCQSYIINLHCRVSIVASYVYIYNIIYYIIYIYILCIYIYNIIYYIIYILCIYIYIFILYYISSSFVANHALVFCSGGLPRLLALRIRGKVRDAEAFRLELLRR